MAAKRSFKLKVTGRGGHAAVPQDAIDPIVACSQLVTQLHTIVSRNISR